MKKIFPALLCLLAALLVSACSPAKKTPAEPEGDAVAVVSIYGYDSESENTYGLMYLGHAFLAFENISDTEISVGALVLQPGEMCSLGSWGMNAHFGIWYNIESNYINNADMYDGRVSVSKKVTADGLAAVNSMLDRRDSWGPIDNCSRLAADVYDAAGGDKLRLKGLITPTKLKNAIRQWTHCEVNRPIRNYGVAGFRTEKGFEEYEYRNAK